MTARNSGFYPYDSFGGNYRNINSFQSFGGGDYYGNSSIIGVGKVITAGVVAGFDKKQNHFP
jgi:hypothetical protein